MRTIRRDFSKFGNYVESAAGGLAVAGIHFDSGPITQGRVIGITVGAVSTVDPSISLSRHVSVTVNPETKTGVRPAIFAISDLIVRVAVRVLHCFSKPVVMALTSDLAAGITMNSKSRALSGYVDKNFYL